ncbi:beta strand repeat-containing protein, partial [Poseidonibacter sp.]|uniref:beta strand repeat-containing protein n=1 Tax=Poseidonibacter sp. TaxID=2321188 RepID=UPI003C711D41
ISFESVTTQGVTFDLEKSTVQDTGAGRIIVQNVENLKGGTQGDTLYGSSDSNKLYGNDGSDTLDGRAGVDSLYGGIGNDTLIGGAGDDFIDGGDDNDTVDYSSTTNAVNLTLADGVDTATASIAGGESDTIRNVENIIGSQASDVLTGNSGVNTLTGGGGNDTFKASGGEDVIKGNTNGTDTLDYSSRGTLNGTDGIKITLNGESESILKENGTNKDHLYSIENITGTQADDTITGDDNSNTLKGGAGDDTLQGGNGNDYLVGGDNTAVGDTVDYSYVSDGVNLKGVNVDLDSNGTKGQGINLNNSSLDILEGIENVIGSNNADTLSGDSSNNTLDGRGGDDTLQGGAGDDVFKGGDGVDTVDYSDVTVKLNIDLGSLNPTEVAVGQGIDTFEAIEGVIGGTNDDILKGTDGANNLRGYKGDDTLIGFGVTDTTNGTTDSLDGGEGTDTVSYSFSMKDITLDLSLGDTEQTSGEGKVVITNVENLEGGFGDDTLTGNNDKNTLIGGFGSDVLIGKGKNDTLDGGKDTESHRIKITNTATAFVIVIGSITLTADAAAEDMMLDDIVSKFNEKNDDGSLGHIVKDGTDLLIQSDQTISVTNGTDTAQVFIDTVDYSDLVTEKIDVDLTKTTEQVSVTDGTEDSKDTLIDIEKIIGTDNNDRFLGDANANTFLGQAGNDYIDGGAGDDYIYGDAGDDTIIGGSGTDSLYGGVGDDTFKAVFGDGKDFVDGGTGSDTVDYSSYSSANGNISIDLDGSSSTKVKIDGVEEDTIQNIENIVTGGGKDTLHGDSENNTLISNDNDDTLSGGEGNDYLDGGD